MAEPRRVEREGLGLDLIVAQAVLVAALIVVSAPALMLGVPFALAIDRRGWRRWPALVGGTGIVATAVVLGAWDAYRTTWARVWEAMRNGVPFHGSDLLGLAPFGLAAGVLLGPVLQIAIHHRNEHETTRHHREVSDARRARIQGERSIGPFSAFASTARSGTGRCAIRRGSWWRRPQRCGGARP